MFGRWKKLLYCWILSARQRFHSKIPTATLNERYPSEVS